MRYPNKSYPQRLGVYTQKIVSPVFKTRGLMEGRIISQWPHIVGEHFASFSLPEKITFPKGKKVEGTLHLTVTSAGSLLLQSIQDMILDKVNTFFGYKAVTRLYMTHGFIPSPLAFKKPPPSAEAVTWAKEQTIHIEDAELKECLSNLGSFLFKS